MGAFGLFPVVAAAWYGGRRWGLGAGVLIGGGLNFVLYSVAMPHLGAAEQAAGAAATVVVYALLGYVIGRYRELGAALRASEAQLRASEHQYRSVVEAVRDAVVQTDAEGRWSFLSPAWERITGYSVAESLGRPAAGFVHPDDRAGVAAAFGAVLRGEAPFVRSEVRAVAADGGHRHVEVHAQPVREGGAVVGAAGVVTDVSDAVRFEAEREARERTEEMLRLKEALLNNMSHELRTPLTGILGYAGVLAEEVDGDLREFVDPILRGGERLMATLNSVLDLAQLEGGAVRVLPVPLDVTAEAQDAVTLLRPLAASRGLSLAVEGAPAPALLDKSALHRVLSNLVGNALKFTRVGGVAVRVTVDGDAVEIAVADTGIGIDPAFLPRLFGEFTQASQGLDREHEGSGLGLAIMDRLVRLMGGAVHVESAVGVGTTFTVTLPATPVASGDGAGGEVREPAAL